ncbi:hypothetical protein GH714_039303 [Hevea brasiliensis]|uniref:ABC transporter domain-containing protein n=1 Tax=Hevea brasiliensis TaxID=3981 RepID=A0A6A6KFW7_HEVBR|nr:hypothetical protein GH714_039303 [Hevea brasiliensis]
MCICLDMRNVLGLDKGFFGNCMVYNNVQADYSGEDKLLSGATQAIEEVMAKMDIEGIMDLIEWLTSNDCKYPPLMNGCDLICGSLEEVDPYLATFEDGYAPIRVSYHVEPSAGAGQVLVLPWRRFLGRVTYNGHGMEEFVPQRTAAYISQYDLHIPEMTAVALERQETNVVSDYILKFQWFDKQYHGSFPKSSHHVQDDEEALKWAAVERLPTYLRVRRGILNEKLVDINGIGLVERRDLLERLVKIAEQDNEKFLSKLRDRIERVGLDMPTIEVRFEHLNVEAQAYIGSRALPTIFNFSINLLGPPSSGKTTLLLALAGKLGKDLKFLGRVTYNGHGMEEFVPQRTAAYISQYDLHIPEMTVRETLAFSARCQGVGPRYEMLAELSRREKAANIKPDPDIDVYMKAAALEGQETNIVTDYFIKILGLEVCADTMVGDEMIRGISGGQKKRLTTGEMLVGPAGALFMDEISTGLDSSTTFQIVNSLRQLIHILSGTALVSLLQPAPETYDLFDDIILLSDGQIVYQGPRENVLEFFEYMGFKCPERKGVADFLQEVTSMKDQEQYWVHKDLPYSYVSVKEFAEAFQSFHVGRKLGDELATPFDKSNCHPAALTTKKYGINKKELLKACFSRELLLMKRNSFVYIFKITQLIIMALLSSTVFLRSELHRDTLTDGGIYLGALFLTVTIMFNGFTELALTIIKLPVFYKQRDLLFYPSWAYALPTWILKIPVTFVEVAIWVIITYYVIGFDQNIERFFKQYLILLYKPDGVSHVKMLVLQVPPHSTEPLGVGLLKSHAIFPEALEMKAQGIPEDRLELLKGITGAFRPGVLTALMGISGAGKTTLMDVLAGRKTDGYIEGSILISGYPKNQETFARMSGYCEQTDIHSPHVTVYESLLYSAWLRLLRLILIQEREALVGLPGVNGLSTEQRKRLTIAVELVANPSIIFMDEPTSGLDARAAAIVMRTLILLQRGGEEIYAGPIGHHSCHLIKYFEDIEGVPKIKGGCNPATWMLEITSAAQEAALGINFADIYKNSELYRRRQQDIFNAIGSMYVALLFIGVQNTVSVQPVVAIERTVFYRERAAGMYSALPYAFGQVMIELPYVFIQTIIYGATVYAMIGFIGQQASSFGISSSCTSPSYTSVSMG